MKRRSESDEVKQKSWSLVSRTAAIAMTATNLFRILMLYARSAKKIIDPELSSLKDQKARLFSNIAASMQGVPQFIIERQLGHFEKVHPDYAAGVRKALAELAQKAKAAK